jgi:uncharacterized metal-binding protein YceD (DUF177 family)
MPALIPVAGVCIRLDDGAHGGKFAPWRRNPETPQMSDATPDATVVALNRPGRSAVPFELRPDAGDRQALAAALGIDAVRKLRFAGTLEPEGARDWRLEAELGATVVQPCVVTLAPVTTRIDTSVVRRYLADWQEPTAEEAEMPDDDTTEALPERLDLSAVMAEALALALPDYPRAPDAEMETGQFAAPGVDPMTDEDAKPLAGLAALRARMDGETGGDAGGSGG